MEGRLSSSDVVSSMQRQLPLSLISEEVWRWTPEAMSHVPVERFQLFWAYQKSRGKDSDVLPPEWHAQQRRAHMFEATGRQRAAGDSKMGLDHILPPVGGSWATSQRPAYSVRHLIQAARLTTALSSRQGGSQFGARTSNFGEATSTRPCRAQRRRCLS